MEEFLRNLGKENYDSFFFLPGEKLGDVRIEGNVYKDPGENLDNSDYGDCYHLILFKEGEDGNVINLDRFEAILTAPTEYMSMLIPQEWFGLICKKTTTSEEFVEKAFAEFSKMV